jgi:hypothetical protein
VGKAGKEGRTMNAIQKICSHVCKFKMIPVETIPIIGSRGIGEHHRRGELKYNIFVRSFVNATMYNS